jgi:hypothetical protein
VRRIQIFAKFAPRLFDEGYMQQVPNVQINGRPFYTTDGQQYAAVDGHWARVFYNGTTWAFELSYNGTVKARWQGPTAAYATPNLVPSWQITLDPAPDYPTPEWTGLALNFFIFSLVRQGVILTPILEPNFDGLILDYYAPVDGRPAYADEATYDGSVWTISNVSLRWVEVDETHGRHWKLSDPDDNSIWRGHEDVATPDEVTVWERDGASGFPLILAEAEPPESISGNAAGNAGPTAPGSSKGSAGGNLAPSAPGAIA